VVERLGGERVPECAGCGRTLAIVQRAWRVVTDAELAAEAERRRQRRDRGQSVNP
jgi:hypothetical protein